MARPIWKGHITFGLVQIPVSLHSAENRSDLSFRLLDSRDHARIRYERVNEVTGEEVPWNDVVKAFEYHKNNYIVLEDEDFKRAEPEATQAIEIEAFVDQDDISPLYYERPYYVSPAKHGEKAYALLRDAMTKARKIGVAKVVIRTRQYLCALMPQGKVLTLMLLRFRQEIRDPAEHEPTASETKKFHVTPKELEMAGQLIASMSGPWKPEKYHDEYRDALMKWIEKKARAGGKMPAPEPAKEEEEEVPPTFNITDLLARSIKGNGKAAKPAMRARATKARPRRRAAG